MKPSPFSTSLPGAAIVRQPIDPGEVMSAVGAPSDGAVLLFLGTVRDHADGRPVTGMSYEAYEEMAADVLAAIACEAGSRLGTPRVVVVHRIGELAVGDVSVAVAVSSPHRDRAYQVSRFVIEEIKRRLPVWKHERFTHGGSRWVEGHSLDAEPPSAAGTGSSPEAAIGPPAESVGGGSQ